MRHHIAFAMVFLGAATPSATAAAPCDAPPPVVRDYLNAHAGWRILRVSDLLAEDQQLWRQYHKGTCPGMAEVDLEGSGTNFFGLALIRKGSPVQQERVLTVRASAAGPDTHTLYPDFAAPPFTVIWRQPPGITWTRDEPYKKIHLPNDSLIAETLEAAAQQFYVKDGKFHHIQTSD